MFFKIFTFFFSSSYQFSRFLNKKTYLFPFSNLFNFGKGLCFIHLHFIKLKSMSKTKKSTMISILRLALISRLITLTLIILFRCLFHPYDTSASLNPPCLSKQSSSSTPFDQIQWPTIAAVIESSIVWDGVYFLRIAECGYEYEQTYAFLPLLPLSMRLLAKSVFAPLVPLVGYRAVLALSGYLLSNVAFVLAAIFLYRLSIIILKDSAASYRACILFCYNPASIFYSSVYSESLYALTSFGGLFYLFSGANNLAMVLFALSGAARSNGAINAGYICFLAILKGYDAIVRKKRLTLAVCMIIAAIVRSIFIFLPFILFQLYGYLNICRASHELRPWCRARIPLLYGFLQSHYWGVGFLRYFQVKQIPNFLLASPTLSWATYSIIWYFKLLPSVIQSLKREIMISDDNSDSSSASNFRKMSNSFQGEGKARQRRNESQVQGSHDTQQDVLRKRYSGYPSIIILPFILHLGFMTFTAFFVMHVQVFYLSLSPSFSTCIYVCIYDTHTLTNVLFHCIHIIKWRLCSIFVPLEAFDMSSAIWIRAVSTRFLSASPPIYWFASYLMESTGSTSKRLSYFILVYSIGYILLGGLLFSNFYPFT